MEVGGGGLEVCRLEAMEVVGWRPEVRDWRLAVWRLEVGSWRLEVLHVGSWKFVDFCLLFELVLLI